MNKIGVAVIAAHPTPEHKLQDVNYVTAPGDVPTYAYQTIRNEARAVALPDLKVIRGEDQPK